MKTQKILLLVLVLLVALCLASCDDTEKSKAPDCFVFDEQASFDDVIELGGEVIDFNEEYNLIALENIELSDDGTTTRKVEILDVTDGNRVLLEDVVTTSPSNKSRDTEYDISDYPIIEVTRYSNVGTDSDGDTVWDENTTYYLINKDAQATALASDVESTGSYRYAKINNVYIFAIDGDLYWINSNLQVMRKVSEDISDSYDVSSFADFAAEYNGYLYTYEYNVATMVATVIVYAPNGVACAQYNFSSIMQGVEINDSSVIAPKVYVLNNGCVLIQECTVIEDDGEYDFVYGAARQKIALSTKIMDLGGGVTERDFDYLIKGFESAYQGNIDSYFPFMLADDYDNQAILIPVADGALGRTIEYVVLDNGLERKYTLNNKYLANYVGYDEMGFADDSGYVATAVVDGREGVYRFDWDGNVLFTYPTNFDFDAFSNTHYVTDSGVYANDGSLIFDTEEFGADDVMTFGNAVYLIKYGNLRNIRNDDGVIVGEERDTLYYKLNVDTGKAELVADSSEGERVMPLSLDGAYFIINEKKGTISFYNNVGTLVLVIAVSDEPQLRMMHNSAFISVEVGGEYKTYVMTLGDVPLY